MFAYPKELEAFDEQTSFQSSMDQQQSMGQTMNLNSCRQVISLSTNRVGLIAA